MSALQDINTLYNKICCNNDLAAYKKLFTLLENPLIAFLKNWVGSEVIAEELYSDLFIKIWVKRNTLPATASPLSYIYTMAKNLALDFQKKQRIENSIDFNNTDHLFIRDQGPTPEEKVISKEMVRKIEFAVNELPDRCKLIFKLIKEDGLKYKEAATLLGISVNTVEVQMGIALKKVAASVKFNTTLS